MEQTNGVVGGLAQVVQYPHLPAGLNGSCHQGIVEQLPIYNLRAGEGKQKSSFGYPPETLGIQAFVALHGPVPRRLAFGKGGRIQHHNFVLVIVRFQVMHHIVGIGLMPRFLLRQNWP